MTTFSKTQTGRPAKSTNSVIEKLYRESIRLSQVQDIAGCRVVVADVSAQRRLINSLRDVLSTTTVIDRRADSSYGYRAVHVIVNIVGQMIEIQVRTPLQHLWAEVSEILSDEFDTAIKYGGGPEEIQKLLSTASRLASGFENIEQEIAQLPQQRQQELQEDLISMKETVIDRLNEILLWVENQRETKK